MSTTTNAVLDPTDASESDQIVTATMDGNEAVAYVAYRLNEVCAIYPITPSSAMAEWADQWSSEKVRNIWGNIPDVIEMQSEGGAAGAGRTGCAPRADGASWVKSFSTAARSATLEAAL